ncbi:MAG: Holo-[acyl-carrier protein] synthase [Ignavibacteriae bacterium]|nr:MAG: Holo-[acyl-carrier protein] synthase [Ignavibacteriota bacterium]
MIIGIGVDVVEIYRMKKVINEWGNLFLEKIFTENELKYAQSKKNFVQHLAARFAAKEAVAKAVSKGWSGGFRWKDVEVSNDISGKPEITLYGKLKEEFSKNRIYISLSHSENVVIAFAVVEK